MTAAAQFISGVSAGAEAGGRAGAYALVAEAALLGGVALAGGSPALFVAATEAVHSPLALGAASTALAYVGGDAAVGKIISAASAEGIELTTHAAIRLAGRERNVSISMVAKTIEKGAAYWDPKNKSITYVLEKGMASGKSILVGVNPETRAVTTVLTGNKLVRPRMIRFDANVPN